MENVKLSERVPVGAFYRTNIEAVEDVRSRYFIALSIPAFLLIMIGIGTWESLAFHARSATSFHQYEHYLGALTKIQEGQSSATQDLQEFAKQTANSRTNSNGQYISYFEKKMAYNQPLNTALSNLLHGNNENIPLIREQLKAAAHHYQEIEKQYFSYAQWFLSGGGALIFLSLIYVWFGILQPIGKQSRERALALARAGEFNEDVINTSRVIIMVIDADGNVVLVNHYFQTLLQWPRTQIVGHPLLNRLFLPQDHASILALLDAGNPEQIQELPILNSAGDQLIMAWTVTPVRDVTGEELLRVAMGVDVTERAAAEHAQQIALLKAQSLSDRLQDEAQQAAELHTAFLGPEQITLPGLSGIAASITSSEVGGDYLDCYTTKETSVLVLGDVSGHGLAAGSIVAVAKTVINQLHADGIGRPDQVLRQLNNAILNTAQGLRLMTMICAAVDFRHGILYIANAGQQFPYLQKPDGQWEMLEIGGLPLGQELDLDISTSEFDMPLGSRLILISDGWIEENAPDGTPFGYERLEQALEEFSTLGDTQLRDALIARLIAFCERDTFDDDLSIIVVHHNERYPAVSEWRSEQPLEIIRISQDYYANKTISPRMSRQHIVLFAEHEWQNLLPRMSQDGIRRILIPGNPFLQAMGWDNLLNAHKEIDNELSLYLHIDTPLQLPITTSTDKVGVISSLASWLAETDVRDDWIDVCTLVADELLENALYAAPRDARGQALYSKSVDRILNEDEHISLHMGRRNNILAIQMRDNWGTLTPSTLLQRLGAHIQGHGLIADQGGGGLYLLWRFSDYMQIRVFPGRETRATLFFDLDHPPHEDHYPAFQFLYHSDICEVNHDYL
ncbi:MAG: PP2C family protein-serine/threonine phosphatase [Acidithiobacillus ferrivorans]